MHLNHIADEDTLIDFRRAGDRDRDARDRPGLIGDPLHDAGKVEGPARLFLNEVNVLGQKRPALEDDALYTHQITDFDLALDLGTIVYSDGLAGHCPGRASDSLHPAGDGEAVLRRTTQQHDAIDDAGAVWQKATLDRNPIAGLRVANDDRAVVGLKALPGNDPGRTGLGDLALAGDAKDRLARRLSKVDRRRLPGHDDDRHIQIGDGDGAFAHAETGELDGRDQHVKRRAFGLPGAGRRSHLVARSSLV